MKIALITGVTGQGGGYLAKALLENDYMVLGYDEGQSIREPGRA